MTPPAAVRGERMSAVDRAWLEMDEPNNPMVVSAVLDLDGVNDVQDLVGHVVTRLSAYPRFRQRVDRSVEPPVWRDAGELSLPYHVRIYHLTEDRPEHGITEAVAREVGTALDEQHPLWRLTVFMRDAGRVTVLFRAHHAIADGMALVGVLMRCTDTPVPDREMEARLVVRRLFERLDRAAGTLQAALRVVRGCAQRGALEPRRVERPDQVVAALATAIEHGAQFAAGELERADPREQGLVPAIGLATHDAGHALEAEVGEAAGLDQQRGPVSTTGPGRIEAVAVGSLEQQEARGRAPGLELAAGDLRVEEVVQGLGRADREVAARDQHAAAVVLGDHDVTSAGRAAAGVRDGAGLLVADLVLVAPGDAATGRDDPLHRPGVARAELQVGVARADRGVDHLAPVLRRRVRRQRMR